jgi:hypothetical protein
LIALDISSTGTEGSTLNLGDPLAAFRKQYEYGSNFMNYDSRKLGQVIGSLVASNYYREKAASLLLLEEHSLKESDKELLKKVNEAFSEQIKKDNPEVYKDIQAMITHESWQTGITLMPAVKQLIEAGKNLKLAKITDFLLPVLSNDQMTEQAKLKEDIRKKTVRFEGEKKKNYELSKQIASVCLLDDKKDLSEVVDGSKKGQLKAYDTMNTILKLARDEKVSIETAMILMHVASLSHLQESLTGIDVRHVNFNNPFEESYLKKFDPNLKQTKEFELLESTFKTAKKILKPESPEKAREAIASFDVFLKAHMQSKQYPELVPFLIHRLLDLLAEQDKSFGVNKESLTMAADAFEKESANLQDKFIKALDLTTNKDVNNKLKEKANALDFVKLTAVQRYPVHDVLAKGFTQNPTVIVSGLDSIIDKAWQESKLYPTRIEPKQRQAMAELLKFSYSKRALLHRVCRVLLAIKDLQDTFKERLNKKINYTELIDTKIKDSKVPRLVMRDIVGNLNEQVHSMDSKEKPKYFDCTVRNSFLHFTKVWKECYLPLMSEFPLHVGIPRIKCKQVLIDLNITSRDPKDENSFSKKLEFMRSLATEDCPVSYLVIADNRMVQGANKEMPPEFNLMRAIVIELLDVLDEFNTYLEAVKRAYNEDIRESSNKDDKNQKELDLIGYFVSKVVDYEVPTSDELDKLVPATRLYFARNRDQPEHHLELDRSFLEERYSKEESVPERR